MNGVGRIEIVAFTANGAVLAEKLTTSLQEAQAYAPKRYCRGNVLPLQDSVGQWAAQRFRNSFALLFIGAAGIAVRAIGPLAANKGQDPAVLCLDEKGRYIIPLLSGHIGGANELAWEVAAVTGGIPVITTATDVNGVFSPDAWAVRQGCAIPRTGQIKAVSSALLDGEVVGFLSDFQVVGNLPEGIVHSRDTRCGIYIGLEEKTPFFDTLWLIPRCVFLGIGCRKGIAAEILKSAVLDILRDHRIPMEALKGVASIDLKRGEPALLAFCEQYRLPLEFYSAEELEKVQGSQRGSAFVQSVTGVDNVCERAALAQGGGLIVEKTASNGVTVAAASLEWRAEF